MRLQHVTEVDAAPQQVWDLLQDTRSVVRCVPGAELTEELGEDRFQGQLRVAIGPLKMNYGGDVAVAERDVDTRRIVLDAVGRDRRGAGSVTAHVRLDVTPGEDGGSRIEVLSDVDLTGRIASLGRGVRDVSNQMFTEFGRQLAARVESPARPEPATAGAPVADLQPAAAPRTAVPAPAPVGEIKVMALVVNVTRERLANALARLSQRIRP